MVTKGGPHSGPPEGHPVVTKGVDPTDLDLNSTGTLTVVMSTVGADSSPRQLP